MKSLIIVSLLISLFVIPAQSEEPKYDFIFLVPCEGITFSEANKIMEVLNVAAETDGVAVYFMIPHVDKPQAPEVKKQDDA